RPAAILARTFGRADGRFQATLRLNFRRRSNHPPTPSPAKYAAPQNDMVAIPALLAAPRSQPKLPATLPTTTQPAEAQCCPKNSYKRGPALDSSAFCEMVGSWCRVLG